MESNGFRAGGTTIEVERLSSALINRANVALRKDIWIGGKPTEAQLRDLCSDCDADGWIGWYPGGDRDRCHHRMGTLVWFATAEGLCATVRKPYERAVA